MPPANRFVSRLVIAFLAVLSLSAGAGAFEDVRYGDTNGDGVFDNVMFRHRGLSFRVFDNDGDMVAGGLDSCCDRDSDTWFVSDGKGAIVVAFISGSSTRAAQFYDDVDGDGRVSYNITSRGVVIDVGHPRVVLNSTSKSWRRGQVYPELEIYVYGVYDLDERQNPPAVDFNSSITDRSKQAVMYLHNDNNSRCGYVQYSLYTAYNKPLYLTTGCLDFNETVLWPVLGFPLVLNLSESRIVGVNGISYTPGHDFVSYRVSPEYLLPTFGPRLKKAKVYNYFWRGMVRPPENYSGNDSQEIGLSLMLHLLNFKAAMPPYADARNVYYTWDYENDGFFDYSVLMSYENPGMNERVYLESPIRYLSGFVFPRRPYSAVPSRIYQGQGQLTVFSVYEGDPEGRWRVAGYSTFPSNEYFYVNDRYNLYYVSYAMYNQTLLPLSPGGRQERARSIPSFYRSFADGRVHLTNVVEGSWVLSADKSTLRYDGAFSDDYIHRGYFNQTDLVWYSDSDADGYVDVWIRYVDGRPVERMYARNDIVVFINESIFFKRYSLNPNASLIPIPVNYAGFVSFEKIARKNQTLGKTLSEVFSLIPADNVLDADLSLWRLHYSNDTAVVEALCEVECDITYNNSEFQRVGEGKYIIMFHKGYTLIKISSRFQDYARTVDIFFNRNPRYVFLLLFTLSTVIFFVLWDEY